MTKSLLIWLSIALASLVSAQEKTVYPGSSLMMRGFSLKNPWEKYFPQIIQLKYDKNVTSMDGKYSIPDSLWVGVNTQCSLEPQTWAGMSTPDVVERYIFDKHYDLGHYLTVAGFDMDEVRWMNENTQRHRRIEYNEISCNIANLEFRRLKD